MEPRVTPERWRRIEEVFATVWSATTGARTAMVRRLAGDDRSLASEVLSLVGAAEASPDHFDRLAASLLLLDGDGAQTPDRTGRLVGPYRLMRLLGQGGMGSVYLAERADGAFEQTVAVKLLPLGMMRPALERRFLAERQILARMEHPNIARLVDGGVTEDETPYFVMEYVNGLPIHEYCERHALSIDRRLRLFLAVCAAVEAAHRNLVIHRDLKPTNVLVTTEGTVKLLDFGIAKLLTSNDGTTEPQPLTPAYASPEQLEGRPLTTAVDVWGLGVILYELLAGRRPFEGRPCGERTQPPSAPSLYHRGLSRDLDTIVLTAIHAQPERRYSSVALLVSDVRRYLGGLPISARAESWTYRLTCFAWRHPFGIAAAVLIVTLLSALTVLSLQSATRAREQAARVARERDASKQVMRFLVDVFSTADPAANRGETVTARELLDRGAARVRTELGARPEVQATLLGTMGRVYRQLGLLDRGTPLLEEALEHRQRIYAAPHPDIAEALYELGLARSSAGHSDEAEKLLRQTLAMRQELQSGPNDETVAARVALGRLLTDAGRPAAGVRELRLAVQHARQLGGEKTPGVAHALYHLAMALHHDGKMPEAFDTFRKAAVLYRSLPVEPTPESAESLLMLASAESMHQGSAAVESLYTEALAVHRRLYGVDHPEYAQALRSAANGMATYGGFVRPEAQLVEAVQIYRRLRVPDQAGLAGALIDLGNLRRRRGDLDEAEQALSKGLFLSRRIAQPVSTGVALQGLAEIHRARGQLALAGQRLSEAEKIYRASLGPAHPMLFRVGLAKGELAHAQGQHRTARALLGETLENFESLLGPNHVQVARTKLALGICLAESGRVADARPLLVAAESVLRSAAGVDAADARRAATALKKVS
jgi:tetratricopeptide (TPR) repeat protein